MNMKELQNVPNIAWLGRFCILKPKKNEKIGIPYKPWHHLAIIDGVVFTYVWDTRQVIDVYPLNDLATEFATIKISDNGKPITVGPESSERAVKRMKALHDKYKELPFTEDYQMKLVDVKQAAEDVLLTIDVDLFDIHDDAQSVFAPKTLEPMENMYMFAQMPTVNPNMNKFADNYAYTGFAKYFAIQARCAILNEWAHGRK